MRLCFELARGDSVQNLLTDGRTKSHPFALFQTCPPEQVCRRRPAQCVTTPCPQETCVDSHVDTAGGQSVFLSVTDFSFVCLRGTGLI